MAPCRSWHSSEHVWLPHASWRPHVRPQEATRAMEQGMFTVCKVILITGQNYSFGIVTLCTVRRLINSYIVIINSAQPSFWHLYACYSIVTPTIVFNLGYIEHKGGLTCFFFLLPSTFTFYGNKMISIQNLNIFLLINLFNE